MATTLDKKWAQSILDDVRALILEIERLEKEAQVLENEIARLRQLLHGATNG